jgi:P-type Cu+ transporter
MNAIAAIDAVAGSSASCDHCGDPCQVAAVHAGEHTFCCTGCASVFSLLQEHGLADFYACDLKAGVSQRRAQPGDARFAALDDPATAARVLDFDDGIVASATFAVPDLHCAACLWLVERVWRVEAGIIRAEADLVRHTVTVWFSPERITVRDVAERLASVGYAPVIEAERRVDAATPERRGLYLRIGLAGFAFGNIMLFSIPRYVNGAPLEGGFQRLFDVLNLALGSLVLIYSAAAYFTAAWRAVRARRVTLDIPIAMGLAALYLRSAVDIVWSRSEGFMDSFTGLVLFLLVGRLFQAKAFDHIAFDRTFRSFLPLSVRVERDDAIVPTPLADLREGDRVLIRPHEVVPADAVLLSREGSFDYAFVTGESHPILATSGARIRAGGRALDATVRLLLVRSVAHSQLARLWDSPAAGRPTAQRLTAVAARFGAIFTLAAVGLAAGGAAWYWPAVSQSLDVATAVLIIACPCALTLAAPLTFGTAMEQLARRGCYLRNSAVILDLARLDTLLFDKTGTLTSAVQGAQADPVGLTDREWRLVRRLAAESTHPASRVIAAGEPPEGRLQWRRETPGLGVRGVVDGHEIVLGAAPFVAREIGAPVPAGSEGPVVAIDGRAAGFVRLSTTPRPGVGAAVRELSATHEIRLVSGDEPRETERWRALFGPNIAFRQSPEDKLAAIQARQAAGGRVAMIGDGLNDAGALAAADVGIAVSDETACMVPACDAVVHGDRVASLPAFLRYARQARQVVIACFVVSMLYNALGISLALMGVLTPLVTAMLMPVSSLSIMAISVGGMRWRARELGA